MMYTVFNADGNSLNLPSATPQEPYNPNRVLLLVDGNRGRYSWNILAADWQDRLYMEDRENIAATIRDLLAGPDSDNFWDASFTLENDAVIIIDGTAHFLAVTETQDIIAVPATMRDSFAELEY